MKNMKGQFFSFVTSYCLLQAACYASAENYLITNEQDTRNLRNHKKNRGNQKQKKRVSNNNNGENKKIIRDKYLSTICGQGTEYDQNLKQCVVKGFASDLIPDYCDDNDAKCFCQFYGYGTQGPKLSPHPSCQKYVSCFSNIDESAEEESIMQCEPGYAYDTITQVCFFKESVNCKDRKAEDLGTAVPSVCLSDINPEDPVCGCGTYIWNSATLVPDECYGNADVAFQCNTESIINNDLEIGIGDGVRPGRALPEEIAFTAAPDTTDGNGYLDAPWLKSESNPNAEYPYKFPLNKTALVMIDFQRDFVCPGGFGETLGNKVEDLQNALQPARNVLKAARALGMPIIHTLESHKSDLSDLKDNKYNRGNLPHFLRIGEELDLGRILVRGSCGNNIVDMVAPKPGEYLIMKPGKTAFYMTNFDELLQSLGVTHLMFAGVTSEVCMQSSVREATDRGYEPLVITDATRSYFERYKQQTIEQLVAQGALVAWAANSVSVVNALEKACQ
mmetsp:Transcript_19055/g.28447  ORF Transcript_19055/g.28447 Transcript_19055/m.28447 type:complete len:504 (-) Transcript_19055:214-1725(-)